MGEGLICCSIEYGNGFKSMTDKHPITKNMDLCSMEMILGSKNFRSGFEGEDMREFNCVCVFNFLWE